MSYGGENGVDLEDVAKTLKSTPDDIVARHIAGDYRVAMIGFTPRLVVSQRPSTRRYRCRGGRTRAF